MNYATPFYFAAKTFSYDAPAPLNPERPRSATQQRRRRIRIALFPAVRPATSPDHR